MCAARCAEFVAFCLVFACFARPLRAHVGLDSPNGGEQLVAGSTIAIQWHIQEPHDTIDWDLWYSTSSSSGPWNVIELNIPPGSQGAFEPYFYDWIVPEDFDTSAWVQVRQDNDNDQDYFATSNSSFSILAQGDFNGSGQVGTADLLAWQSGYGTATGAAHNDGDGNLDQRVDGFDFLLWQQQAEGAAQVAIARAVPEPTTWFLFLTGCAFAFRRGRR